MFVAARAFELPAWSVPAAIALWIVKDVALYPVFARSYARRDHEQLDRLIGTRAVVTQVLDPEGWVRAGAELWRARSRSGSRIEPGADVIIEAVERMTLVVSVPPRA